MTYSMRGFTQRMIVRKYLWLRRRGLPTFKLSDA
jgi:hypothetical protein